MTLRIRISYTHPHPIYTLNVIGGCIYFEYYEINRVVNKQNINIVFMLKLHRESVVGCFLDNHLFGVLYGEKRCTH